MFFNQIIPVYDLRVFLVFAPIEGVTHAHTQKEKERQTDGHTPLHTIPAYRRKL